MDILEFLKSPTRAELAGDRVTSYGMELGGGSINYWDGRWDNDPYGVPRQLENILNNRDGLLELFDLQGHPVIPRVYHHSWQPDRLETRFLTPHLLRLEQTRWIDNDVVCVKLAFHHSLNATVPLELRWSGERLAQEKVTWRAGHAHLYRTTGALQGIHRIFSCRIPGPSPRSLRTNSAGLRVILDVPRGETQLLLFWSLGPDERQTLSRLRQVEKLREKSLTRASTRWRRFFTDNVPNIEGLPAWLTRQYYMLFYVQQAIACPPAGGPLAHPFTCPSKFRLLPQWFWDGAFQSIVDKWLYRFPPARGTLLNSIESRHPSGHMGFALDRTGFLFDRELGFPAIQPFILPMAVWDIYLHEGKTPWLRRTLDGLVAFDRWMEADRGMDDGLICIRVAGETGWDNSVRFLQHNENMESCGQRTAQGYRPADFNTYVLIGRQIITRIAALLGRHDLAAEYARRCSHLQKAIQALWSEKAGLFVDRLPNGQLGRTLSPGGMIPILAGLGTPAQLHRIVKLLSDPRHFWSRYPVPTLSLSDPRFTDQDDYASYWNGRTWPNVNWLLIEGLMRRGLVKVARELTTRTLEMVSATGEPRSTENYHPRLPHKYDISCNIFCYGWGSLPNDLLLRRVLGIQPRMAEGQLCLSPFWMPGLGQLRISNLHVGGHLLNLDYTPARHHITIHVSGRTAAPLTATTARQTKKVGKRGATITAAYLDKPTRHWLDS